MSDFIPIRSTLARCILDQWLMLDHPIMPAAELYKCTKCLGLEITYKWNLGMCPEELTGINMNCHPSHKNGIQAYLAVDATPTQGGIAFYTCTGWQRCYYYQPNFNELGIKVDRMRPTDFEMINLLIALFIFKNEILNHKTVRIITDNNYLRKNGKMQRHGLTEAIASILQWCDDFGCTINEIFKSNTPEDDPFLLMADRMSRNKEISKWAAQMEQTHININKSWKYVICAHYIEIPSIKRRCMNERFLVSVNKILLSPKIYEIEGMILESHIPQSYIIYECPRFRRMMLYFEGIHRVSAGLISTGSNITTPSNESCGSWMMTVFICAAIIFIYYVINF